MNLSLTFMRVFFAILSFFFMMTYAISHPVIGPLPARILVGLLMGGVILALSIGLDQLCRRANFRSFNVSVVGLFFGSLMGECMVFMFKLMNEAGAFNLDPSSISAIKVSLFLMGAYLGTALALKFADELYISIPFVRFSHSTHKKKDLLLDLSALNDLRIVDLCAVGILDNQVVVPRFLVKLLNMQLECGDEMAKAKARKTLENLKKLEGLTHLQLRYTETDFPEIKDQTQKLARLAKLLDANIMTADASRISSIATEDISFINLHALSNALKPLTPPGESITIKVQRYGKEPKQGVGYLDDGTMVVINNGGDYIGEVIETQVISVKQTSAGRIIFTNAAVEDSAYHSIHSYEQQTVYEHQHD